MFGRGDLGRDRLVRFVIIGRDAPLGEPNGHFSRGGGTETCQGLAHAAAEHGGVFGEGVGRSVGILRRNRKDRGSGDGREGSGAS